MKFCFFSNTFTFALFFGHIYRRNWNWNSPCHLHLNALSIRRSFLRSACQIQATHTLRLLYDKDISKSCMYYFKIFAYKVGTMYYQTLFSANSAWAAEEVKGWLVPETGPLLTIFCGSPSLVPDTHQHGSPLSISSARTVLTRSSLPLSTSQKSSTLLEQRSLPTQPMLETGGSHGLEEMGKHPLVSSLSFSSQRRSLLQARISAGRPDFRSVKLTSSFITCIFPFFRSCLSLHVVWLNPAIWCSNRFHSSLLHDLTSLLSPLFLTYVYDTESTFFSALALAFPWVPWPTSSYPPNTPSVPQHGQATTHKGTGCSKMLWVAIRLLVMLLEALPSTSPSQHCIISPLHHHTIPYPQTWKKTQGTLVPQRHGV